MAIDEVNHQCKYMNDDQIERLATEQFSETDLIMKFAYPFRFMSEINLDKQKSQLNIRSNNFQIQFKYLNTYDDDYGSKNNKS